MTITKAELQLDIKVIQAKKAAKELEEARKRTEALRKEESKRKKSIREQQIIGKDFARFNKAHTSALIQNAAKQRKAEEAKAAAIARYNKDHVRALGENQRRMKGATKQVGLLAKGWQHFKNIFSRVALALTAFVIIRTLQKMTIGFVKSIIDANKVLEVMGQQLDVLYKYGTKTERVFEFLKIYAITTPFQIQDLIKTTVALKAFSIDVEKNMKAVGDWAAAINKGADETALAYAKIIAGSPRTRLLLTTRGIAMSEFMSELERTGNRSVALFNIVQRKFGGMAERMATTMEGLISNIRDILFLIAEQLGKPLFEALKRDISAFHDKLRELYENREMLRELGDIFRGWYTPISAVGKAIGALGLKFAWLSEQYARIQALTRVHPETGGKLQFGGMPAVLYEARYAAQRRPIERELEPPDVAAQVAIVQYTAEGIKNRLKELKLVQRLYLSVQRYREAHEAMSEVDEQNVFRLGKRIQHYEELLQLIEEERKRKELAGQIEDKRQITAAKALQSVKLAGEIESKIIEDVFKHWKLQFEQGKLQDKQLVTYAHIKSLYEASLNPMKALADFLDVAKDRMQILETGTEEFDANMKEAVAAAKALRAELDKIKKLEEKIVEIEKKIVKKAKEITQAKENAYKKGMKIIELERSALLNEMIRLDKEVGKWQAKMAQAFVGGIRTAMTGFIDYLLFGYSEAGKRLDERIEDLQTELAIEQGRMQELTREESLQKEIARLESERANRLKVELVEAGRRFVKAMIGAVVQIGVQIAVSHILYSILKGELELERRKTRELKVQLGLKIAMAILTGGTSLAAGAGAGEISTPGPGFMEGYFAQRGFKGIIKKPTAFVAGERGPEYVSITPSGKAREAVSKTIIDIHDCEIYDFEDFVDQIKNADRRLSYERVA